MPTGRRSGSSRRPRMPSDTTTSCGPMQGTGGSTAMANSWEQLRKAGATARAMLVEAAAKDWGVPASEITVDRGVVSHAPSGRRATFGELVPKATALTPPTQVPLKDPKDWKLVGKRLLRVDGGPRRTARRSSRWTSAARDAHGADRAAAALRRHREVVRRGPRAAGQGRDACRAGAVGRGRRARPASGRPARDARRCA